MSLMHRGERIGQFVVREFHTDAATGVIIPEPNAVLSWYRPKPPQELAVLFFRFRSKRPDNGIVHGRASPLLT